MAKLQIRILPSENLVEEQEFDTLQEAHDAAQAMVDEGQQFLGGWVHDHETEIWTSEQSHLKIQVVED